MPLGVRLTINGEKREISAATVAVLVGELGLDPRKVAVERNLEIVPKSQFAATDLNEGDRIEIVHFIGGG
jgi:thiamine biosynthesis protein ThiS